MSSVQSHTDLSKESSPDNDIIYFEKNYSMGWLLPLLLFVLTAGFVMYFVEGNNDESIPGSLADDNANSVSMDIDTTQTTASLRKHLSIKLSDSSEIIAYKNGIENQLVLYIMSKERADSISKNRWFDFDDLNFKTNSADITDSSMHQVQNIAAILKAYPNVKIKIGGYTDKSGDEIFNLRLSNARATAVLDALKKAGVKETQLTGAEGYGSEFAKAEKDAPDSLKQKDRRISINVRAK
jgi:outer membrane protein OmpA-like peptidoglycan-associated protein